MRNEGRKVKDEAPIRVETSAHGVRCARAGGVGCAAVAVIVSVMAGGKAVEGADGKGLYLVVTRRALVAGARTLAAYRRETGYDAVVEILERPSADVASPLRAEAIRACIDRTAASRGVRPAFIVLCGDETADVDADADWRMPATRKPLYRWRSNQRTTFTSDSCWGDLNDDGLPDVPVGRVPARSSQAVRAYVDKLRRYEAQEASAEALRTVLWMGIPGYDAKSDALMTPIAMETVRRYLPDVLTCWWLSGDPRWPCWLPRDEQAGRFLAEMRAGSVFNLFCGHGSASKALANISKSMRTALTVNDLRGLPSDRPSGPLVFLACTIGRFEWSKGPCLGEALWGHPGGPVVVIAASTQSHPLTNYYSAIGLARTIGRSGRTIGEWWVAAQRVGYREHSPVVEAMLKDAEGKLEPRIDVVKLRRDQPPMFNILGDPACRLRLPEPLAVDAQCRDGRLVVRSDLPEGVRRVAVGILLRQDRPTLARDAPMPSTSPTAAARSDRRRRLDRFNAQRIPVCEIPASPGRFELDRALPAAALAGQTGAKLRLVAVGAAGRTWAGVADIAVEREGATR